MENRQVLIDIWTGDSDIDHKVMIENGIKGMIFRINSIAGGHHLDSNFALNYENSKKYLVRGIYFVYNPWVKGKPNLDWLLENLPKDYNGRIFIDLEVRYQDYPPLAYANEVAYFFSELSKKYKITPYTGAGYLDILSYWPKTEYWWANYQYNLYPNTAQRISWKELYEKLDVYTEIPISIINICPTKNISIWQCTGDRLIMPGMLNHAVDLSLFFGSEEELVEYFGSNTSGSTIPIEDPIPEEPITPTQSTNTIKFKVNVPVLNIRSAPGTNNTVVGKLKYGDIVEVKNIGGKDCWAEIEQGWIYDYLDKVEE